MVGLSRLVFDALDPGERKAVELGVDYLTAWEIEVFEGFLEPERVRRDFAFLAAGFLLFPLLFSSICFTSFSFSASPLLSAFSLLDGALCSRGLAGVRCLCFYSAILFLFLFLFLFICNSAFYLY